MKIKAYIRLFTGINELSYRGYHAVKATLIITDNFELTNASRIQFPPCKDIGSFVTDIKVGDKKGRVLYEGKLDQPIYIGIGVLNSTHPVTPQFEAGGLKIKTNKGKKKRKTKR